MDCGVGNSESRAAGVREWCNHLERHRLGIVDRATKGERRTVGIVETPQLRAEREPRGVGLRATSQVPRWCQGGAKVMWWRVR